MSEENKKESYTSNIMKTFRIARQFCLNNGIITRTIFSPNGEYMMTSSVDDQLHVFDCTKGQLKMYAQVAKYGADAIQFTHAENAILHSSTKGDDEIRYLSFYDNKYIRFFFGHTERVTSIAMSPIEDIFLSSSYDRTVRLWDFRAHNSAGIIFTHNPHSVIAFDANGEHFSVGVGGSTLKKYDRRNYSKGPYATCLYGITNLDKKWTDMQYSRDGLYCLLSTNSNEIQLLEANTGDRVQIFKDFKNAYAFPLRASLSPDSKYVLGGSTNGKVHIWHQSTGCEVTNITASTNNPAQCVAFNPKYAMFVSASNNITTFWRPIGL